MLKRVLSVSAAATLVLALSACVPPDQTPDISGVDFITTDGAEPQNPLLPADINDVPAATIVNLIYSGLVYLNEEGEAEYDVAQKITQTSPTEYDVVLREDAKFSDGSSVRARDFVDSWNAAVQNNMLSSYFFKPILGFGEGEPTMRGLKVTGDRTFHIELAEPTANFVKRLGHSVFFPMHPSAEKGYDAYGMNPIGNGPYRLARWDRDEKINLIPNAEYVGPRKSRNEGLEFRFYETEEESYAALQRGELDLVTDVPITHIHRFEEELDGRSFNETSAMFSFITIPANDPMFRGEAGALRRRAISMSFDRTRIAHEVLDDTVTPVTCFATQKYCPEMGMIPGQEVLVYNPEKARELWAKADAISPWTGPFLLGYNADGGHAEWVDAVTKQVSETLGIEAYGRAFSTFKKYRQAVTDRQMRGSFRSSWQAAYPSEVNFLEPVFASSSLLNESGFNNPEFDRLLKEANSELDQKVQEQKLLAAQSILLHDLPALPLWESNVVGGYDTDIARPHFSWKGKPFYFELTRDKG